MCTAGKIAIKNMLKAEQSRAKLKKREEEWRMSQWRNDNPKYDYLISTHFKFNEYS